MENSGAIPRLDGSLIELRLANGEEVFPPPVPLSSEDHAVMEALAVVYSKRLDLGGDKTRLPVLVSYGFDLVADDPKVQPNDDDVCLIDRDGNDCELLMRPLVDVASFDLESKFISKLLREAYKLYPDVDHRALWVGDGSDLSPDGRMRIEISYAYYVPDASRRAPDYVNSPALASYPTKVYPAGFARVPPGHWFRRSIRDASYNAPAMAVLFPFDDLVGLDFGQPPKPVGISPPFRGALDGVFPIGVALARKVSPEPNRQLVSYTWDGALAAVDRANEEAYGAGYPVVENMPAVMELLRMQRASPLIVKRVPLGGIKRRNQRTKKRNVGKRKALKRR